MRFPSSFIRSKNCLLYRSPIRTHSEACLLYFFFILACWSCWRAIWALFKVSLGCWNGLVILTLPHKLLQTALQTPFSSWFSCVWFLCHWPPWHSRFVSAIRSLMGKLKSLLIVALHAASNKFFHSIVCISCRWRARFGGVWPKSFEV